MTNPNLQEHIDNIQLMIQDLGNNITSSQAPHLKALEFKIGELFTAVSQQGTIPSNKDHDNVSVTLNLMAEKLENLECLLEASYERIAVKTGAI